MYNEVIGTIETYIRSPSTILMKKISNGTGQIVFRELLLIIDHTSYHIGEFAIMRQVMGTWKTITPHA